MKRKKGEKNIWITLIKLAIFVFVLLIQVGVFYVIYKGSLQFSSSFNIISRIIQIIAVLYILYGHEKLAYKIPWLIFIMFLPVAGVIIYFLWATSRVTGRMKKEREQTIKNSHKYFTYNERIETNLNLQDKNIAKQVRLIKHLTGYPVYNNEEIDYFDLGEKCFESALNDIKQAKKYILLEFYIIAKGNLYDRLYDVLKEKLNEGVKVIIIADGLGSLLRYPKHKMEDLIESGAIVKKYNPLRYGINTYINYRDHRKIVVIDGKIAYTGGVNIADEYVNEYVRFGHWKDNGIRLKGKTVLSYTIAFLKNLEIVTKKTPDYEWFLKENIENEQEDVENGYTMFYTDGPDNRKNPSESLIIEVISYAKKYIYIYTPYLVPSPEVLNAILNAANSGVDVRIITPHKPDKWYVHFMTRSYYDVLVEAGVRIYEYLPGFLHAKTILADDNLAICGSVNLDYRSLNLNYECGQWMYKTGVEEKIREDFEDTISKSKEITIKDIKSKNIFIRMVEAILNTFAPLF